MAQRVTRVGYNPYRTPSNIMKLVKGEDGKLYFKKQKKAASKQKCGECKNTLIGLAALRPAEYARQTKSQRTINRIYGGNLCASCVEVKVVKSFLLQEKKHAKEMSQ
ncbi:large subunit ribosomal protein L34e [Nematocida sp. AWRm80]|nr:large subunit ribosomal protein L34e [Nematocida sp. AWRm80]